MTNRSILFIVAFCSAIFAAAAEPYCHKQLVAGDKKVYVTAKHLSDNNYLLRIEADENLKGLGGSFIYVNGDEPYQLNTAEHAVLADDKRSITCDITSTVAPKHYTPLYVLFENGGESNFGQPDADYSQTCEGIMEPGTPGEQEDPTDPTEPDKPEPGDPLSPYDVNFWTTIDWLGNGSGVEANTEMYKIYCAYGQQVANIQVAPWDNNNVGIYTWVEAGVTSVSVDAGVQGSGVLLHLSAFVNMITEVQIETTETTYLCHVFFKNGVDNTISSDPENPTNPEESAVDDVNADASHISKTIQNGKLLIEIDGMQFDILGQYIK